MYSTKPTDFIDVYEQGVQFACYMSHIGSSVIQVHTLLAGCGKHVHDALKGVPDDDKCKCQTLNKPPRAPDEVMEQHIDKKKEKCCIL